MSDLNPNKLKVTFRPGTSATSLQFPRRYTLTHSDTTGDLFLSIGSDYDQKQINGLYTRFMRDEVLAELLNKQGKIILNVYVHVSGGLVFGTAGMRNGILHQHMPMVLEAFRWGDKELYTSNPELDNSKVLAYFSSKRFRYNKVEEWGTIKKYNLN